MNFKIIKVKLSDTSADNNPLHEQVVDKPKHNERATKLNNDPAKSVPKTRKPFRLVKKVLQENNNSKTAFPTENKEKAAKSRENEPNINITASENSTGVQNESTSHENKTEGSKLNDEEKKLVVPFVYRLKKTRKDVPPNEPAKTVENIQNLEKCKKLKV